MAKATDLIKDIPCRTNKMVVYNIDGKDIKTNLKAMNYPIWNGNDFPSKYTSYVCVGFTSVYDVFNSLVEQGHTEIRFVEMTTCVRGYHKVYAWYR